jgi:hypothetical protein
MSNIADIVINDGAATPVAHTFAPDGQPTGYGANYADRATGIQVGFPTIKLNISPAQGKQSLNKVRVRLAVPRLETIAGVDGGGFTPAARLAYLGSFDGTFIFNERATKQERKDVRVLLANLLANVQVVGLVDDLQPLY